MQVMKCISYLIVFHQCTILVQNMTTIRVDILTVIWIALKTVVILYDKSTDLESRWNI
jgi:hypothetical protein